MEETVCLTVRESRDWEYLSRLAKCPGVGPEHGIRLFRVWVGSKDAGGFALLPQPSGVFELHTELKTTGPLALEAFRLLARLIGTEGITKLTSYVERDNRKAAMMAAAVGFKRAGATEDKILLEWQATTTPGP